MTTHNSTFGQQLRALRTANGLTQEALADKAGLSVNAINSLERGERRHPYPHTVAALAHALGLSDADRASLVAVIEKRKPRGVRNSPNGSVAFKAPSPIFGRNAEVATAIDLIHQDHVHLLTVTGPGGVGKSRLALQLVTELQGEFADGALMVPLAAITEPRLVASAILGALDVQRSIINPSIDTLISFLRDRNLLLVLDNVEQVIGAAPMIAELLGGCPGIKALATSSLPLHLDGEQEFPLSPLPLPTPNASGSFRELAENPAVALFLHRARLIRPDFDLTADNAAAIANICIRLDGLPLAIELAAAHSRLLSPQAILENLSDHLIFLADEGANRPARHRTMHAAVAWSHDLLAPREQALFRRLAAFVDGAMLQSVIELDAEFGAQPQETLTVLSTLVNHSLLSHTQDTNGDVRFDMLEVIRAFAIERLLEHGEHNQAHQVFARQMLALASKAREDIEGPGRRAAHERIVREMDNIRAARTWFLDQHDTDNSLILFNAMARFCIDLGLIIEGRAWAEWVIALPNATDQRVLAETLYWGAGFANLQNDSSRAIILATEALDLARDTANRWAQAMALTQIAEATGSVDPDGAEAMVRQAQALFRETGDRVQEALALRQIGMLRYARGDVDGATLLHTQALRIWRSMNHPWGVPDALAILADSALDDGDLATARAQYRESLGRWRQLGERIHICQALTGLARVALASNDPRYAAFLIGAEDALEQSMGYVSPRAIHAKVIQEAMDALGDHDWFESWEDGYLQSLDAVLNSILPAPAEPS